MRSLRRAVCLPSRSRTRSISLHHRDRDRRVREHLAHPVIEREQRLARAVIGALRLLLPRSTNKTPAGAFFVREPQPPEARDLWRAATLIAGALCVSRGSTHGTFNN